MKKEIKEAIDRYVKDKIPTGGFLKSVLSNDLVGAITRADHINKADLEEIVHYCIWNIPSNCWGSPEIYRSWVDGNDEGRKVYEMNYE